MKEIKFYKLENGNEPVKEWLLTLDSSTRVKIVKRLERIYGYTRNEIKEITEYKMNKIINLKIEKFKILYFIPKNFLDNLSLQISSY